MKQKSSFDIAKVILSVFIVAIHTMGKYGPYPILRIAVPVFFMVSGYLFFSKYNATEMKVSVLYSFIKRNLELYAFWFIALLPIFIQGFSFDMMGVAKIIVRFLVGSTFASSWYLMALVIGVCLVFYSNKISGGQIVLMLFAVGSFCLCCLFSNYRNLLTEQSVLFKLLLAYPGTIYNSFPVSLIWIIIGKKFADYEYIHGLSKAIYPKWYIILGVSLALLIVEYLIVAQLNSCVDNDCYFMLLPVCASLFGIILNINIDWKYAKIARKASTIVYCLHGSVAIVLKGVFVVNAMSDALLLFLLTLVLCLLGVLVILILEKIPCFKWLKYAY